MAEISLTTPPWGRHVNVIINMILTLGLVTVCMLVDWGTAKVGPRVISLNQQTGEARN